MAAPPSQDKLSPFPPINPFPPNQHPSVSPNPLSHDQIPQFPSFHGNFSVRLSRTDQGLSQEGRMFSNASLHERAAQQESRLKEQKHHLAGDQLTLNLTRPGAQDCSVDDEDYDLEAEMRKLQIVPPRQAVITYQKQLNLRPEENSPYQLIMKIACSSGKPRNIPLQPLNEAMRNAWGKCYWVIDQLDEAVYKAYFRDMDDMDSVILRQPWTFDRENLLLEWVNPKYKDKPWQEYSFKTVYVPPRVYGVPERFRVPYMMRKVIQEVAQPSDIHPPPEIKMTIKEDYVEAYAKMDVSVPVQDMVKYYVEPDKYIILYINYGKIKRICTSCGIMFHTSQFCPKRRRLILHLQSMGKSTARVPFEYIGIWTSQPSQIPDVASEQSKVLGGLSMEFRKYMKVHKTESSSARSLSNFMLSDESILQTTSEGRERLQHNASNQQEGMQPDMLNKPIEAHTSSPGLLGPYPAAMDNINATSTGMNNAKTFQFSHASPQHQASPFQATCKRQLKEDSPSTNNRLKRQATEASDGLQIADEEEERGQPRFRSVPPSSPQLSATASSQAWPGDSQNLYCIPQHRQQKDSVNLIDNSLPAQAVQAPPHHTSSTILFSHKETVSPGILRRRVRPKGASRWDDKRQRRKSDFVTPSGTVGSSLPSDITVPIQQAKQIEGAEGSLHKNDEEAVAPAFKAPRAQ